jgi:hypothetical protein
MNCCLLCSTSISKHWQHPEDTTYLHTYLRTPRTHSKGLSSRVSDELINKYALATQVSLLCSYESCRWPYPSLKSSCINSLIRPFIHSFIHPLTRSPTHLLSHSCTHSLTHSRTHTQLTRPLVNQLVYSPHTLTYWLTYVFSLPLARQLYHRVAKFISEPVTRQPTLLHCHSPTHLPTLFIVFYLSSLLR